MATVVLKAYNKEYILIANKEFRLQKHLAVAVLFTIRHWHIGKEIYEKEKKAVSKTDCNNYCNRELKKDYEWLKAIDKFALTNAIYNMDAAYQKFFKEHAGYPKFKSKHDNHKSYTTNLQWKYCGRFETGKIKLPKLKAVKARLHREYRGQIKSRPFRRFQWKITMCPYCRNEHKELAHTNHNIGIDLGIKDLCITSMGRYMGI